MKISAVTCLAISMAFLAPITASAANKAKPPQPWQNEPNSFVGIRFDQKVDEVLPLCPPRTQRRTQMCHEEPYQNLFTVAMGPDLGFGYSLSVFAGGEGVESFYLTTDSENYSRLAQLLITKYGAPTDRSTELVKTKAGAEFNNETMRWRGSKVAIVSQRYGGDINTSVVTIKSISASEKSAADADRKTKESASKL